VLLPAVAAVVAVAVVGLAQSMCEYCDDFEDAEATA
jgi:hypothetical protein